MKLALLAAAAALAITAVSSSYAATTTHDSDVVVGAAAPETDQALIYPILWWTDFPEWFGPSLPPIRLACFGSICGCITVGGIRICV